MATSAVSKRIDAAYAKHSGDIAKLLKDIRSAIHATKSGLEETWKWGPGFALNGKLLIGLWGFKNHVSLVLYRGAELMDKHKLINDGFDNAHNRMVKFTEYKQFNKKKVMDLVKEAVKLEKSGAEKVNKSQMKVPAELTKFFSNNKAAGKFFSELPHSFQREYVQYITKVKTKATREKHVKEVCAALKTKKRSL
jgi:uncharacterized protein YdeI (YjbR/CyaY-like superfamily)